MITTGIMKDIPDPIQQAIWVILRWAWDTYGKEEATRLLESIIAGFGANDWLNGMLELFNVSDELDWEKYIIQEADMTCKQG